MHRDCFPLTPDQISHKLRLMNRYIALLGDQFTQERLEKYEGLFTTCARQGVQPNWSKITPAAGMASEGVQEAAAAVKLSAEGNDTAALVLRNSPTKVCRDCLQSKILTAFYKRSDSKDGRHASCSKCMSVKALELKRAA